MGELDGVVLVDGVAEAEPDGDAVCEPVSDAEPDADGVPDMEADDDGGTAMSAATRRTLVCAAVCG